MSLTSDPYDDEMHVSGLERPAEGRRDSLPTFCLVVFIIDLVLCAIRLLMVCAGVFGLNLLREQGHPLAETVLYELAAGAGIVLFGVAGNGLMLAKQGWAVALGWLNLAATFASIGVGIWQATMMIDQFAQAGDDAQRIGGYIGASFSILVRLALCVLYVVAMLKFSTWSARRESDWT